jgi:hypothetical protein
MCEAIQTFTCSARQFDDLTPFPWKGVQSAEFAVRSNFLVEPKLRKGFREQSLACCKNLGVNLSR